jgi:broad specificity phosphatase PhoE
VHNPLLAKRWEEDYPNSTAPGGESFQQFTSRVRRETAFLLAEAPKSPIAVVTHAGFIRVVLTKWYRVSEQAAWDRTKDYGSVVALDANHVEWAGVGDCGSQRPGVRTRPHRL